MRFPAAEIQEQLDAGLVPTTASIRTFLVEGSVIETFSRVILVPGTENGSTATIDLESPIFEFRNPIVADNDFMPLFLAEPHDVAERLQEAIDGGVSDFFLVVQYPEEFAGLQQRPPFVGLDRGQVKGLLGRFFISSDGGITFSQLGAFNGMMRLVFDDVP